MSVRDKAKEFAKNNVPKPKVKSKASEGDINSGK
jgi:hypothetical protein